MPKSRLRKNRKPYRPHNPYRSYFVEDPAALFFRLGSDDDMGHDERTAAAEVLFREMGDYPREYAFLQDMLGANLWPPKDAQGLIEASRAIANMTTSTSHQENQP